MGKVDFPVGAHHGETCPCLECDIVRDTRAAVVSHTTSDLLAQLDLPLWAETDAVCQELASAAEKQAMKILRYRWGES